jgi:hypothetical protein
MKKHLDNPLFLPTMTCLVGTVNIFLNLNKTVGESWWYTLLPLVIGIVWLWLLIKMRKVD